MCLATNLVSKIIIKLD
uniref:Uncharacterized protein n=1 Tax=Arundo donax TaxID=35708 RepID=A0A0A9C9Q0_ARUDO